MNPAKQPMTNDERQNWLLATASDQRSAFIAKFARGMVEHKGDIGEVPFEHLLAEMQQEALDQLAYVAELRRRVNKGDVVLVPRSVLSGLCEIVEIFGSCQVHIARSSKQAYDEALQILAGEK